MLSVNRQYADEQIVSKWRRCEYRSRAGLVGTDLEDAGCPTDTSVRLMILSYHILFRCFVIDLVLVNAIGPKKKVTVNYEVVRTK